MDIGDRPVKKGSRVRRTIEDILRITGRYRGFHLTWIDYELVSLSKPCVEASLFSLGLGAALKMIIYI
jgi:hypothetical protein